MADNVVEGLPPGFRFFPTEEELVSFYLHQNKLEGKRPDLKPVIDRIIPTLDITQFNPWDLPNYAGEVCREDSEWFFFIPMQEREARGGRPNRLTNAGYWKATGCPGYVYSSHTRIIGVKRTMVFYQGRAPAGQKTEWKMNEYKAIEADTAAASSSSSSSTNVPPKLRHEFSLCRLYKKSKNMRAFDRRPSWAGNEGRSGAEEPMVTQVQVPGGESTSYGHQHQDLPLQLAPENMASSPEGSSSGHGGSQVGVHPSPTGHNVSTTDMNVDNWDWSTLDWF